MLAAQEGELRFEHLSVEHGLSHSTVRSILQDREGYLWIGTQEGLNRYDGYRFKVFKNDPEDPGSLSESEVSVVYEDRAGELWVGTHGGLDRFQRHHETFIHYRHDPGDESSLSHDLVLSLLEDRHGRFWVGTEKGLNRLDPHTGRFVRYRHDPNDPTSLSHDSVWALYEDRTGTLWAGTRRGLNRLDDAGFVHYRHDPGDDRSLSHDWVLAILEDDGGRLWVGTRSGLNRFDDSSPDGSGDGFVRYRHDPDDPRSLSSGYVRSLYVDPNGELYAGTFLGGLNRLDPHSGGFVHVRHDPVDPESLANDLVTCMYRDRTGILWLGTYLGVDKYNPAREQFTTFRQRPGRDPTLSGRSVWAILEDRAGVLWVGTYENGLNRIDRERGTIDHFEPDPEDPASLRSGAVSALVEDRAGDLWVGTWGGLSRLGNDRESQPAGREAFVHYRHDPGDPQSLSSDTVQALHEDAAGRLWVGTFTGLNRLSSDHASRRFIRYPASPEHPRLLGETSIYAIYEDRTGTLWFGSDRAGLFRLGQGWEDAGSEDAGSEDSERFIHFRHDPIAPADSLSSDKVSAIYQDRTGTLWIGTFSAGLNRLDLVPGKPESSRFAHYRERDGLANDTVLGILEDDGGNLWLSTNRGLSRFDPRAETFRNYDAANGLQGNVYSAGSAFRSPRGEMFFGGIQGFDAFFPERISGDPHPPPVVITDFRRLNRSVPLAGAANAPSPGRLVISHRDMVFSFEFAALHYASPPKNRYAYRLEGFDGDWVETDATRRFAQYSNLDPGNYHFQVKASNVDGLWNEEGTSVAITVTPPFWGTFWFRLAGFAAGAALLLTVHRSVVARNRRRHQQFAEREKAAQREQLISELETKNTELERFAYTVAHDLRSPLVTIQGFLGFLERDVEHGDPERVGADVERIRGAAGKMQRLIEDLLQLSRIGRRQNPPEEVGLDEIARETEELLASPIAERGVELTIAPDLPVVVGDRVRLQEMMQNLVENAVRYMGQQQRPRIEIGMRDAGPLPVFFVRDNGMGIDPRHHDRVFALFERLDAGTEGSGLGLALVKRIIDIHGGQVWVESQGLGCGSTFCFTLPDAD